MNIYILIDEIYPFSDLNILCKVADNFYNSGIPFIVAIMPVYNNFEYPAFKRYSQVLRYIQSRDGSIVLHNPIINESGIEYESIDKKLMYCKTALKSENIMLFDYPQSDTFITYTLPQTEDELNTIIKEINSKWITISNYKKEFTDIDFSFDEDIYSNEKIYTEQQTAEFHNFFRIGNNILIIVVGISIIIFILLIIIGYRLYNKKFYK